MIPSKHTSGHVTPLVTILQWLPTSTRIKVGSAQCPQPHTTWPTLPSHPTPPCYSQHGRHAPAAVFLCSGRPLPWMSFSTTWTWSLPHLLEVSACFAEVLQAPTGTPQAPHFLSPFPGLLLSLVPPSNKSFLVYLICLLHSVHCEQCVGWAVCHLFTAVSPATRTSLSYRPSSPSSLSRAE